MASERLNASQSEQASGISKAILDFLATPPTSDQVKSDNPDETVKSLISGASWKSASVSATLAIPPGPLGLLTIIPDLVTIWRIQAQLVADIAASYGKSASLTPETLLYCLFKHGSAHLFRDFIVRVGERYLVRRVTLRALQAICAKLGVRITQRLIGKTISRWIPVVGALAVGAYAKYDTSAVGENAKELFSRTIDEEASNVEVA